MKTSKIFAMVAAVSLIAAFAIGADLRGNDRPSGVPVERWIEVSAKAGFAVTSGVGAPTVAAELYLKTEHGWQRARVDNPISIIPLSR